MKRIFYLCCLLVLGLSQACTTTTVSSDYAKGTDFGKYKSYAWLPDIDTTHQKPLWDNDIFRQNLHQAVNNQMVSMGYALDTVKPDMLLIVHASFHNQQQTYTTPMSTTYPYYYPGYVYSGPWYPYYYRGYYNYPYITGYDVQTVNYTEGTIVVDMIDRDTKKLVWRGWSEGAVNDPQAFERKLPKRIHDIFMKFPGNKGNSK